MSKPKDIKVNSLSYRVKFEGNKFIVGCQEIGFNDARKVAEFILAQEAPKFQVGGVYKGGCFGDCYVLVQVGLEFVLQNLDSSTNWTRPRSREGVEEELNDKFEFVGETVQSYYETKGKEVKS